MRPLSDYKALISDFDGTLVDAECCLSVQTAEAVGRFIDKGYLFSIATGRRYSEKLQEVVKVLKLKAPLIINGGAEIIDPLTHKIIWHEYMAPDDVDKLIDLLSGESLHFWIKSQGKVYGPGKEAGLEQVDYSVVASVAVEHLADLAADEKRLQKMFPDLHVIRGGAPNLPVLDITSGKATKHLAALELSRILNINPKDMIGVGDGYNDYPLLSACGFKAAMASAPPELKSIADMLLPDVDHGGVAVLIEQILG